MARLISDDALAAVTIWQEARGEPYDGKVGVAEVIRNRMAQRYMSDGTVAGTVLRAAQFSGWNTIDRNRIPSVQIDSDDECVQDCLRAWHDALAGSDRVGPALHYLNVDLAKKLGGGLLPLWAADPTDPTQVDERLVTARIGRHTFFRKKET